MRQRDKREERESHGDIEKLSQEPWVIKLTFSFAIKEINTSSPLFVTLYIEISAYEDGCCEANVDYKGIGISLNLKRQHPKV